MLLPEEQEIWVTLEKDIIRIWIAGSTVGIIN
jgi:hypothetical protein